MRSMTGYGRGESTDEQIRYTVELKTVNNRYCEILIKQPRQFMALEDRIKKYIAAQIERGRVEVFINIKEIAESVTEIRVNFAQAAAYHAALTQLSAQLGTEYRPDVQRILTLPDVISHEDADEDLEHDWAMIQSALHDALAQHTQMRETEGENIRQDMLGKLENMEALTAQVADRAPLVTESYRQKLNARINEILGENVVDPDKLAQEVAFFGEKSCIDEELVRLGSHFAQFRKIIGASGGVGRKLDFLIQEMNRETNTIGSKANDLTITALVVEMKSELEKLREQIQNIE